MAVIRPKRTRVKKAIKPGSKAKERKRRKHDLRNTKGQFTKARYENRDLMGRFAKKNKRPPVRYRRPTPIGMKKIGIKLGNNSITAGYLLEFTYGFKQKEGEVGGWKNDPQPLIIVFNDDQVRYVEGVNTNYLSEYYLKKVRNIMVRFPGINGEQLYNIFKRTARYAIKKGYRKYIRTSLNNIFVYVYEDEVMRTIDEIAKNKLERKEAGGRSRNPIAEM